MRNAQHLWRSFNLKAVRFLGAKYEKSKPKRRAQSVDLRCYLVKSSEPRGWPSMAQFLGSRQCRFVVRAETWSQTPRSCINGYKEPQGEAAGGRRSVVTPISDLSKDSRPALAAQKGAKEFSREPKSKSIRLSSRQGPKRKPRVNPNRRPARVSVAPSGCADQQRGIKCSSSRKFMITRAIRTHARPSP